VADAGLDAGDDAGLGGPQGGVTRGVTREVTRDIQGQPGDGRQLRQQLMAQADGGVVLLQLVHLALQLSAALL
jgi:hypothetical protein